MKRRMAVLVLGITLIATQLTACGNTETEATENNATITEQSAEVENTPDAPEVTETPQATPTPFPEAVMEDLEQTGYAMHDVKAKAAPEGNADVLAVLEKGTELVITGKSSNGWYRIDMDGAEAYVYAVYVTEEAPETVTPEPVVKEEQEEVSEAEPTQSPQEAEVTAVPTEAPVITATPTPEPTPVPVTAVETKQVGYFTMYVWNYTTNGTPLYDVVNSDNPGYPQYMIDALSDSGVTPDMSDYDKAVTVARYLARRVSYDYSHESRSTTYYTLHNNKTMCQGYSNTFSQLMYMLGIECYVDYNSTHAWNRVVINNTSYYVDITYNVGLGNEQYMMVSYDYISQDHIFQGETITLYDAIWSDQITITIP